MREGAATSSRAQQPGLAVPPPAQKGSEGAHTSPARSSSRGPVGHPQEKATSLAKQAPEAPIPSSAADAAKVQEPPVSLPAVISSRVFVGSWVLAKPLRFELWGAREVLSLPIHALAC